MASAKSKFNESYILRPLTKVRQFERKSIPSEKTLTKIIENPNTAQRNKSIKKVANDFASGLNETVKKSVNEGVQSMATRVMADELKRLSAAGIKISNVNARRTFDEYMSKFNREKFLGRSSQSRLNAITKRVSKDLESSSKNFTKSSNPARKVSEMVGTILGKRRGYYSSPGKYVSFSAKRTIDRFIASEVARSRRGMIAHLSETVGSGLVRWITRKDPKVCPLCRSIEAGSNVDPKDLQGVRPEGVYYASDVPISHPFCRCRLEVVISFENSLLNEASGNVDSFLGQFDGKTLTSAQSAAYLEEYAKRYGKVVKLSDIPEAEKKARVETYREMVENSSITAASKIDRMFANNVSRGQLQSVKDLAAVLGKNVPDELMNVLGPENISRILMKDASSELAEKASLMFKDNIKQKVEKSLASVDEHVKLAEYYKGMSEAAPSRRGKALIKNAMATEINAARREAGQALGYVDGQERYLKLMKEKPKSIYMRFPDSSSMDDFIKKYPNKDYIPVKGKNVISLDVNKSGGLLKDATVESSDFQRVTDIKKGKMNVGPGGQYNPRGTKKEFSLFPKQESVVKFMKDSESAIINSAPGTGKTPMTIAAIRELQVEGKIEKKVLYVTKNRLESQVVDSWDKFVGNNRAGFAEDLAGRKKLYSDPNKDVHVISHSSFLDDAKKGLIKQKDYDAVIFDEFQEMGDAMKGELKNFSKPRYRFALSGTPVKENINEAWKFVDWVDPKLFKMKSDYVNLYSKAAQSSPFFQDAVYRDINKKMYKRLITQKQLELKPMESFGKEEVTIKLGRNNAQIIKNLENKYASLGPTKGVEKTKIRAKMKEFLDGPIREKVDALNSYIVKNPDTKKIIFVQDANQMEQVEKALRDSGARNYWGGPVDIHKLGSITKPDKVSMVKDAFKESIDPDAIIIMDRTATAGHDFPFAGVVVNWSPPANYSGWEQRVARAWRKGNKGTKTYDMFTDAGEDLKRIQSLKTSRKVFTAFSEAEEVDDSGLLSLIREELMK